MTRQPTDLLGGESVYCINEGQLRAARLLVYENPATAPALQAEVRRLEASLSRNERAALAFILIERLLHHAAERPGQAEVVDSADRSSMDCA